MVFNSNTPKKSIILGINGWQENGHDAAAAVVNIVDGHCSVLGALEEEKVIRKKCAYDCLPVQSVAELMQFLGIHTRDIQQIVFGWNYPEVYQKYGWPHAEFLNPSNIRSILFPNDRDAQKIPVSFINHHLSHASSAFRTSPFEEAIVLILDGQGEKESGSLWIGRSKELTLYKRMDVQSSLGYLYEAVNDILGFRTNESGKTMGLAAYGEPVYLEKLEACFSYTDNITLSPQMEEYKHIAARLKRNSSDEQERCICMWIYYFYKVLGIQRREKPIHSFYEVEDSFRNLAASVQKLIENIAIRLLRPVVEATGIRNICMGGGVALNCKMNGVILAQSYVDALYAHPASNDAGVALGAALEWAHQHGSPYYSNHDNSFSPYLGISYSDEEIMAVLEKRNIDYVYFEDSSEWIAEQISAGRVIALFQGRNEWGPRALGNRTILSSAARKDRLDYINSSIKRRELGRPLGPSILEEELNGLPSSSKTRGRYMNIAYTSSEECTDWPAIIHVDGTFRPQYVNPLDNPLYYRQLKAIQRRTGTSVVINTSFNLTTPIIYYIEDAIDFYLNSDLDALIFNNHVVLHKSVTKDCEQGGDLC